MPCHYHQQIYFFSPRCHTVTGPGWPPLSRVEAGPPARLEAPVWSSRARVRARWARSRTSVWAAAVMGRSNTQRNEPRARPGRCKTTPLTHSVSKKKVCLSVQCTGIVHLREECTPSMSFAPSKTYFLSRVSHSDGDWVSVATALVGVGAAFSGSGLGRGSGLVAAGVGVGWGGTEQHQLSESRERDRVGGGGAHSDDGSRG